MKRRIMLLLLLVTGLVMCFAPKAAAKGYAPKPESHSSRRDGYTLVWFVIPEGAVVNYTADGSTPTKLSPEYRGEKLRFEKDTSLKLMVRKAGTKAKIYNFRAVVKTRRVLKPAALKKGDTIAIAAPSRYIEDDFQPVVEMLENRGYRVKVGKCCYLRDNGFAGTPAQRAEELNGFFADDDVDAILCLRGGAGAKDILDLLDYELIKQHPKMFIGFSDITFLHSALFERCCLVTVHDSMIYNFVYPHTEYTERQFFEGIKNEDTAGDAECPAGTALRTLYRGEAEGRLVGGNLSCAVRLMDTAYGIEGDHCILLLEDVHEDADSIDSMLRRLEENGLTDRADGIVFGEFTDCGDSDEKAVEKVLRDFAKRVKKPCIMGLPAGHGEDNMFLPMGVRIGITANADGTASFTVLENAFE